VGTADDPLTIDNVLAANGTSRSGTSQPVWLRPGLDYAVAEQGGQAGYQASPSIKCVAGDAKALSDPASANLNSVPLGLTINLSAADAKANPLITCEVVNTDIPPQLTLIKEVDGANPKAWTLTASADCPAAGEPGHDTCVAALAAHCPPAGEPGHDTCVAAVNVRGDARTPNAVTAGLEYRLSETLTDNDVTEPFAAHAWVCESTNGGAFTLSDPLGSAKANVVSLTLNAHVTCTLTNVKAALRLEKWVDNGTTGGTAGPSDFTLTLTRTVAGVAKTTDLTVAGGDATTPGSTQAIWIRADTYAVTESPARGYTMEVTGCVVKDGDDPKNDHEVAGAVSLDANGHYSITLPTTLPATSDALPVVVCTVKNNAIAPKLTLGKDWPGQSTAAGDVTLTADPNKPTDRHLPPVTGTMGYDKATPLDAHITGQTVVANAPYALTETIDAAAPLSVPLGWDCVDRNSVDPNGGPASATMSRVRVGDADVPTVVPQVGQDIVCTVTNVTAQVAIRKGVANTHGGAAVPSDWSFTLAPVKTDGSLGDPLPTTLSTDKADDPASPEGTHYATTTGTVALKPGQLYHVIEDGPTGYESGAVTCRVLNALTPGNVNDVSTDGDIVIPVPTNATAAQILSATVVCEITNADVAPLLTLAKNWGIDDGTGTVKLTATPVAGSPAAAVPVSGVVTVAGNHGQTPAYTVVPGVAYELSETLVMTPRGVTTASPWSCVLTDAQGVALVDAQGQPIPATMPATAPDKPQQVKAQVGQHVTCSISNATILVSTVGVDLVKKVDGGSAKATDWVITLTPPEGSPYPKVTGPGTGAMQVDVTYTVTEKPAPGASPVGYPDLGDLSCSPPAVVTKTVGRTTLMVPGAGLPVDATIACTLTNTYNVPPPPPPTEPPPTEPPAKPKPVPGALSTTGATATQYQAVGGTGMVAMGLIAIGLSLLWRGRRATES